MDDDSFGKFLKDGEEVLRKGLLPSAQEVINKLKEVDKGAHDVVKTFGLSDKMVLSLKSSLTGAVSEVERLGGAFSDVVKIQQSIGTSLGRGVVLTSDAFDDLYAATQVTGQGADYMVGRFKDAGVSAYDSTKEMEKVVNTARSIGVNVEQVSNQTLNNMGELNKFNFKGGVEGLAKMAAQATNLRIDMSSTLGLAEKVFDPEGAIEVAASMQRLGVAQSDLLDPLRLMDLAQNDPAELQNQLAEMSKQFTKLNSDGNFEILPGAKRQLREISKALGMNYQDLSKMALGSADLERKMSQIRFPDTFKEEDKKLIANLSEMKDGVATVKFSDADGNQVTKNVSELSPEDLEELKKVGESKTLEEIQEEQLSVSKKILASQTAFQNKLVSATAGTKTSDDLMKLAGVAETTIMDTFSNVMGTTSNITKSMDTASTALINGFESLLTGEKSIPEVFQGIGDVGIDLKNKLNENFGVAIDSAIEKIKLFSESNNNLVPLIETLGGVISNVGNYKPDEKEIDVVGGVNSNVGNYKPEKLEEKDVKDFIKMPGQIIKPLPQDTLFGGTGFNDFIESLKGTNGSTNNNQNNNQSTTEVKTTADVNLNIKIDAPNQIDTNQILLVLENQGVKQKMVESMKEAMYNNGLTSPTSSKSKLMNPYVES